MKILISGICGFVGSTLARSLVESDSLVSVIGFDNFSRAGSHLNKETLESLGIRVIHADIRQQSDVDNLPQADWVIDAAANPSVLAGVDGFSSSRQVVENNLYSTVNLLEYCRRHRSGFILLSSSRVYSIEALRSLPLQVQDEAYCLNTEEPLCQGVTTRGLAEEFSVKAPVSLYGGTKLCSESLALEYGFAFKFPVWINRCGVLAGAGQFGRPDQGIFTFWINSYLRRQPLQYIGYGGYGYQVRDCLHPKDLLALLKIQMNTEQANTVNIYNLGGGQENSMSLKQLSSWCQSRFGTHQVESSPESRNLDVPWLVMDYSLAAQTWNWEPVTRLDTILEEIAAHAQAHPEWLKISSR